MDEVDKIVQWKADHGQIDNNKENTNQINNNLVFIMWNSIVYNSTILLLFLRYVKYKEKIIPSMKTAGE